MLGGDCGLVLSGLVLSGLVSAPDTSAVVPPAEGDALLAPAVPEGPSASAGWVDSRSSAPASSAEAV
ncbi:MAG: hypothetical protein ACRDWT_18445 [Jatrophihabitantaceae bacterium]